MLVSVKFIADANYSSVEIEDLEYTFIYQSTQSFLHLSLYIQFYQQTISLSFQSVFTLHKL